MRFCPPRTVLTGGGSSRPAKIHGAGLQRNNFGPRHRFRGHLGPSTLWRVSDEFLVTGSADKTVKIWNLKPLEQESKASNQ